MTSNSSNKTYIIAEAGVNHNGSIKIAKSLIHYAKKAGADAIKFQLFDTSSMVTKYSTLAPYQKNLNVNSQYELIKKLEININFLKDIIAYSKKLNIDFMISIFDEKSLKLINSIRYKNYLKIPSGEITNSFLLKKIRLNKYKIILSTGMSNNSEIVNAINLISKKRIYKCIKNRVIIMNHKHLKKIQNKIVIMHCVTEYPTNPKYLNLRVINKMKNDFLLNIGFSDHTIGIEAPISAVYAGAQFVEKHFTISKKLIGPDHKASINFFELKEMINKIKKADEILGKDLKEIQKCEKKNVNIVRKFLVARNMIKKHEKFSLKNLTCKRSVKGVSPMNIKKIIGKKAKKKFLKDEVIKI